MDRQSGYRYKEIVGMRLYTYEERDDRLPWGPRPMVLPLLWRSTSERPKSLHECVERDRLPTRLPSRGVVVRWFVSFVVPPETSVYWFQT